MYKIRVTYQDGREPELSSSFKKRSNAIDAAHEAYLDDLPEDTDIKSVEIIDTTTDDEFESIIVRWVVADVVANNRREKALTALYASLDEAKEMLNEHLMDCEAIKIIEEAVKQFKTNCNIETIEN